MLKPNDEIDRDKPKTVEAYDILKKDYEAKYKEILIEVELFKTIQEKINYIETEILNYLLYIADNPILMAASGVTQTTHIHESGLDNKLRLLIKRYKHEAVKNELPKKQKFSFELEVKSDADLLKFYNLMKDKYQLILPETTYEQFIAVFTKRPIDKIVKIKRTNIFTNALLVYFVNSLFSKNYPYNYLSIAERCFSNAKNLGQTQQNYTNNKNSKPKNHNCIDELIQEMQNPL